MPRSIVTLATGFAALSLGGRTLGAQAPAPEQFLIATYYECDYALEGTADLMLRRFAPVLQKHVDAGQLSNFAVSAHVMGGAWRRLVSMTGERDALLDVWVGLDDELRTADPAAFAQFNATCGSHQDYLWARVDGSPQAATPPPANQFRLSTYFFCNQAQEESVDTLVNTTIGPEIQKHVAMGHLTSWGWLRHDNGGTVRRVLTFTAPEVKALFRMRDAVFEGVGDEAATKMFGGACGNHFEYVWADVSLSP